eukprot:3132693-Pleurochrysis_carterae.AAC.1
MQPRCLIRFGPRVDDGSSDTRQRKPEHQVVKAADERLVEMFLDVLAAVHDSDHPLSNNLCGDELRQWSDSGREPAEQLLVIARDNVHREDAAACGDDGFVRQQPRFEHTVLQRTRRKRIS